MDVCHHVTSAASNSHFLLLPSALTLNLCPSAVWLVQAKTIDHSGEAWIFCHQFAAAAASNFHLLLVLSASTLNLCPALSWFVQVALLH